MTGIWILSSTEEESRVQYLESGIHCLESRIQDCVWLASQGQKVEVTFTGITLMLKGIYGKIQISALVKTLNYGLSSSAVQY